MKHQLTRTIHHYIESQSSYALKTVVMPSARKSFPSNFILL